MAVAIAFDARVQGWLVPASSLIASPPAGSPGSSRVFLVEGGRLRETAVRAEPVRGGEVLLTGGLPAAASIVREAAPSLRDGMAVEVRP